MKTKICSKCKQEKDSTCFHKDNHGANGLYVYCKECRSIMRKVDHAEKICPICKTIFKPKMIDSSTCGNPKCTSKLFKDKNKEKISLCNKEYYAENRESEIERSKAYYHENIATLDAEAKKTYRQRKNEYNKNWNIANPDKVKGYYNNEKRNNYEMNRKQNDINYKIVSILRKQLVKIVRGHKIASALNLLDCSIDDFRNHLASTFQDGMSFDNYGDWHLDHILPCSVFDLQYSEEQEICFHYTNLQALWAEDNIVKSNNII